MSLGSVQAQPCPSDATVERRFAVTLLPRLAVPNLQVESITWISS